MHITRTGRPPMRRALSRSAVVLAGALAVGVLAQGTGQAQSSAALGNPANAWLLAELASSAGAQRDKVATGVGDVPFFGGTDGYRYAGTRDGVTGSKVPSAGKVAGSAGRLARLGSVSGLIATGASFVLPWVFNAGTPTDYADPPAVVPIGGAWSGEGTASGDAWTWTAGGTASVQSASGFVRGSATGQIVVARSAGQNAGGRLQCVNTPPSSGTGANGGTLSGSAFVATNNGSSPHTYQHSWCAPYGGVLRIFERHTTASNAFYTAPTTAPTAPPAGAAGTTSVTTTTTSQCSDGSSSRTSMTYTRTTSSLPPITVPGCPAGTTRTGLTQSSVTADGRSVSSPLGNWTPAVVPSGFPQCQPSGTCQLVLVRRAPAGGEVVCNSSAACADWQTQTQRDGTRMTTVTRPDGTTATVAAPAYPDGTWLECRFGPYLVAADECAQVVTDPAPPPSSDPMAEQPDPTGRNCVPDFSFNPVSWVLEPVKCALRWAFVPSSATTAKVQSLGALVQSKPPGSIVVEASAFVTEAFGGSGEGVCWVLTMPLGDLLGSPKVLDTCNGPVEGVVRDYRPVLEVLLYAALLLPLAWWAWGAYAPGSRGMA